MPRVPIGQKPGRRETPAPPGVESIIIKSRPFVEVDVVYGRDEIPTAAALRGAVVKTRVVVPSDLRARWESEGADALRSALATAHHAYPPEVRVEREEVQTERRVVRATDPEAAFSEFVDGLGLKAADLAAVREVGLEIMHDVDIL